MIKLPTSVYDAFGYVTITDFPIYATTVRSTHEADWKSDMVHHYEPIPFNTKIEIEGAFENFYGTYLETHYKGQYMSIDPRDVSIEINRN